MTSTEHTENVILTIRFDDAQLAAILDEFGNDYDNAEHLEHAHAQLAEFERERNEALHELAETARECAQLRDHLIDARRVHHSVQTGYDNASVELDRMRSELDKVRQERDETQADLDRALDERETAKERNAELRNELAGARQASDIRIRDITADRDAAGTELDRLRRALGISRELERVITTEPSVWQLVQRIDPDDRERVPGAETDASLAELRALLLGTDAPETCDCTDPPHAL